MRSHDRWDVPRRGIRQAALLFFASALLGFVIHLVPALMGTSHPASYAGEVVNGLVGVVAWWGASRPRMRPALAVMLPLAAIANVGWSNSIGAVPPTTFGTWFVLVYVWVGMWLPRGTAALSSPLAAAAYLASLASGAPRTASDMISVLVVIPVAVLAGETVAKTTASLRAARTRQEKTLGELARANLTDPLTGIGNRRMADMLLESLAPTDVVVLIDVDRFKAVNDRYGHSVGDQVLRSLGTYLSQTIRANDGVARVGGEEFLVVMRKADARASEAADRLVTGWRATSPTATISAGAAIHLGGTDPAATYQNADLALYRAKDAGRDRAVGPEPSPGVRHGPLRPAA